jgi:hypothetical protein
MADSIRVDDRELRAALDKLERELGDMAPTHTLVVRGLLPGVVLRTPRRTGTLAGSWRAVGTPTAGEIVSDVGYAGPVEYGVAGRTAPAAMIADTIAASEGEIVRTYEDAIRKAGAGVGFDVQ